MRLASIVFVFLLFTCVRLTEGGPTLEAVCDSLVVAPTVQSLFEDADTTVRYYKDFILPDFVLDSNDNLVLMMPLKENMWEVFKYDAKGQFAYKKVLKHHIVASTIFEGHLYIFDGLRLYIYNPLTIVVIDKIEFPFLNNKSVIVSSPSTTFYSHLLLIGEIRSKKRVNFSYDLQARKTDSAGNYIQKETRLIPDCLHCDSIEALLTVRTESTEYWLHAQSNRYILFEKIERPDKQDLNKDIIGYYLLNKSSLETLKVDIVKNKHMTDFKFQNDSTLIYQTKDREGVLFKFYRIKIRNVNPKN
jgi:hypothetical protein